MSPKRASARSTHCDSLTTLRVREHDGLIWLRFRGGDSWCRPPRRIKPISYARPEITSGGKSPVSSTPSASPPGGRRTRTRLPQHPHRTEARTAAQVRPMRDLSIRIPHKIGDVRNLSFSCRIPGRGREPPPVAAGRELIRPQNGFHPCRSAPDRRSDRRRATSTVTATSPAMFCVSHTVIINSRMSASTG